MVFGNKTRRFTYSIPDLSILNKCINVESKECKTLDDLKKIIASFHHIKEDNLYFEKETDNKIKKFVDGHNFVLIFHSSYPNINLHIPNGQKILIKDGYKMEFNQIFQFIEKGGNFYTQTLINNSLLYLNQCKIKKNGFPFVSSSQNSLYELRFTVKTVTLKYDNYFFTASENENTNEVISLIQKPYQNLKVSILDSDGNKPLKIKSNNKYIIRVEKYVKFTNINNHDSSKCIYVDYFEKVEDVEKSLAKELDVNKPDTLIIIDLDKNQIHNLNKPLREIYNLDNGFFFRIIEAKKKIKLLKPKVKEIPPSLSQKHVPNPTPQPESKPIVHHEQKTVTHHKKVSTHHHKKKRVHRHKSKHAPEYKRKHSVPEQSDESNNYDEPEYSELSYNRTYFYSIPELSIHKKFHINFYGYYTVYDIKCDIASHIGISNENLQFKEIGKIDLREIPSNSILEFDIKDLYPDVTFYPPNYSKIVIKNGYKMKFNDILIYFEKAGLFYSEKCIQNNMQLFLMTEEVSKEGFPFLMNKKSSFYSIRLINNPIEIECCNYRFTFSDGEYISNEISLFRKVFHYENINVIDSHNIRTYILLSKEKYKLQCQQKIDFIYFDGDYLNDLFCSINIFATITEVKKSLYSNSTLLLSNAKPEDLILYDSNKKMISDPRKCLYEIQNLNKPFYYKINNEDKPKSIDDFVYDSYSSDSHIELSISKTSDYDLKPSKDLNPVIKRSDSDDDSIKLIIIFSTNNEKQFYPIRKNISVKTTINEIIKIVSNEHDITDKITINYELDGKMEELLPTQTIEQVKSKITENDVNGKERYCVYVKIQSKSKTKKINSFDDKSEVIIDPKPSNLLHDESTPKKPITKPKIKISPKVTYDYDYESHSLSYFDISGSEDDYDKYETRIKDDDGDDKKSSSLYTKAMKPEVSKSAEIDKGKDRLRKSDFSNDSKSGEEEEENNERGFKTTNRKKISKFIPKTSPISTTNSSSHQTKKAVPNSSFYTFEFDGEEKQIKLQDESTLELQEEKIKDEFNISPNEQLLFKFVSNDDHKEEVNIFKEMNIFKNGTIHIYI